MSDSTKKTETFILNIYNRQNATWQGSVTWVEKKEKQQFRSALELLKLIESALDEEEGENHESRNKKRLLALVLCMVVAISNSSFIFASETGQAEYPQEAEVQTQDEAVADDMDVAAYAADEGQAVAEEQPAAVEQVAAEPAAEPETTAAAPAEQPTAEAPAAEQPTTEAPAAETPAARNLQLYRPRRQLPQQKMLQRKLLRKMQHRRKLKTSSSHGVRLLEIQPLT